MAYPDEKTVQIWLAALRGLDVRVKKMFGCYCLYCDDQPVGWISGETLSLREVGLPYLPTEWKRPSSTDPIQEIVIPLEYADSDWLPRAVQDTAKIRKTETNKHRRHE